MKKNLSPGPRRGIVTAPSSKSQAQRLLLCASAGERETRMICRDISRDVEAMIDCLNALGACIREEEPGVLTVSPIRRIPQEVCLLHCGQSAAVLRFLLPFVGAIGAKALFQCEGRLPQRPTEPFYDELRRHGMTIEERGREVCCEGKLQPGEYTLPGGISSQFISGLLMSLPLLQKESRLVVTGDVVSSAYIDMTEETLSIAGIRLTKSEGRFSISVCERPRLPDTVAVEGDWSGAAAFLCMGALSVTGLTVRGLNLSSSQGDRKILELLRGFGAELEESGEQVTVRRRDLNRQEIDASQIPDLIPTLSALAAAAEGETRIRNAARLRWKESDRLRSTTEMLRILGADVVERPDGLLIRGKPRLDGGCVDCASDHRIAMAAAVAAAACRDTVAVLNADCVEKSYPGFWEDWDSLEGEGK